MPRFVPYDESESWKTHEAFYARRGVNAWIGGDIPHLATNNRALARQLGALLLAHVADARLEGPIGVLEIGGGLGTFAAQVLAALDGDLGEAGRKLAARLRYVFSDFIEGTVAAAARGRELAPHVAAGRVIPAVFDARRPESLRPLGGGEPPPIVAVVANYLCCVLPTKPLRRHEGRWWQLMVAEGVDLTSAPQGAPTFDWAPVQLDGFFADPRHGRAAQMTLAGMDRGTLNVPYGFLTFVEAATSGAGPFHPRAIVCVTDFGWVTHEELINVSGEPRRYGMTLNHDVAFPLFDDFAAETGLSVLRTHEPLRAVHNAVLLRGEPGAALRRAFAEHFVAANAGQDLLDHLTAARFFLVDPDLPLALRYLLRALPLDPDNPELHLLVGKTLVAMGRAREGLERLLAGRPLDVWQRWDFDYRLGEAYLALGDGPAAIAAFEASLARSEDGGVLLALGAAHEAAGDDAAAYRCFKRAVELEEEPDQGARMRMAAFREAQWLRFVRKAGR